MRGARGPVDASAQYDHSGVQEEVLAIVANRVAEQSCACIARGQRDGISAIGRVIADE